MGLKEAFFDIKDFFVEKFINKYAPRVKSEEDKLNDELYSIAAVVKSLHIEHIKDSPMLKEVVLEFIENKKAESLFGKEDWFLDIKDTFTISDELKYDVMANIAEFVHGDNNSFGLEDFKEYVEARYGLAYVEEAIQLYNKNYKDLYSEYLAGQEVESSSSDAELISKQEFDDVINGVFISKLDYAIKSEKDNFEYMLKHVSNDGYNLRYASDRLKNNEELVWEAVKNNHLALFYASDEMLENKEILNYCRSIFKEGMKN